MCSVRQIDGIAMGSSWEAALTIIFAGFQKERLFDTTNIPLFYKQYVANICVVFSSRSKSWRVFHIVNQLHQALTFTCEFKNINLPFLDVFVL